MSLARSIEMAFKGVQFSLKEAYERFLPRGYPKEQIRARIYEQLGKAFQRVGRGLYVSLDEDVALIEGDGRDISFIKDNSIQLLLTDHPWEDEKSNKGGNRAFASYETFRYTEEDFKEKARVLQDGCFCVEFLPAENENNYEYLYEIKKMAQKAGLNYFCKVPWTKGTFVANTGRKAKNTEDVMIFVKGKPRAMRPDAKKDKNNPATAPHYMSGCRGMLPTDFNVQPPAKNERIHQSEKPVELIERLLDYLTFEGELVLDQFAGSGVTGEACRNKSRLCILIEKSKECCKKIAERLNLKPAVAY